MSEVEHLKSEVEAFRARLERKDRQLKDAEKQLAAKTKHFNQMSDSNQARNIELNKCYDEILELKRTISKLKASSSNGQDDTCGTLAGKKCLQTLNKISDLEKNLTDTTEKYEDKIKEMEKMHESELKNKNERIEALEGINTTLVIENTDLMKENIRLMDKNEKEIKIEPDSVTDEPMLSRTINIVNLTITGLKLWMNLKNHLHLSIPVSRFLNEQRKVMISMLLVLWKL